MNWLRSFDFDDLLILYNLGRGQSISATGRELGLTQPAITQRLQKLESIFGVKVCERRGAKAELTEAGAVFAGHAIEAIELLERTFGRMLPPKGS